MDHSNKKIRYAAIAKSLILLIVCCGISAVTTFQLLHSKYLENNMEIVANQKLETKLAACNQEKIETEGLVTRFDSLINQIYLLDKESEKPGLMATEKATLNARINNIVNALTISIDGESGEAVNIALNNYLDRLMIYLSSKNDYLNQLNLTKEKELLISKNICQMEKDKLIELKGRIRSIANKIHDIDWCKGTGRGRQEAKDELFNQFETALR